MLNKENDEKLIQLCQNLVRTKSYSGEEEEVSLVLKSFFEGNNFDEVKIDSYGNVVGIINGKKDGPTIVFDGHLDTVPIGDELKWSVNPFGAEIKNNRIYGRGTSDMKGGLSAMAIAALDYAQITDRDFLGRIIVAGIVHEELFEGVASKKICDTYSPDYVVIGESSELNLKIGQRGRAEIAIETFGMPSHSAHPENGNNAVYSMCEVINAINNLPVNEHPILKKGILELTDIKSDPYPGASCVPSYCRCVYDRRTLVGETRESVLDTIKNCLMDLESKNPKIKAKASYVSATNKCYTGEKIEATKFFPAWLYDKDEKYIQDCLKQLNEDGFYPDITIYDFCTNGSYYAGVEGIKTIGIGPSKENLAHTIDEYIELSQLNGAANSYLSIIKALLK
ncbi:MAG: YgeY family selenium metabolism-linked hydrolase [Pleomorphochaeta sp.]